MAKVPPFSGPEISESCTDSRPSAASRFECAGDRKRKRQISSTSAFLVLFQRKHSGRRRYVTSARQGRTARRAAPWRYRQPRPHHAARLLEKTAEEFPLAEDFPCYDRGNPPRQESSPRKHPVAGRGCGSPAVKRRSQYVPGLNVHVSTAALIWASSSPVSSPRTSPEAMTRQVSSLQLLSVMVVPWVWRISRAA
jgi:hypothetical protein